MLPAIAAVQFLLASWSAPGFDAPQLGSPTICGEPWKLFTSATAVSWSRSGRTAACAGTDGIVRVFDVANGKVAEEIDTRAAISDLTYCGADREERIVIVVGRSGLRGIDPKNGDVVATLDGSFTHVAVSPDRRSVAASTNHGEIWLLDPALAEKHAVIAVSAEVDDASFSPDASLLLVEERVARTLHVVDVAQRKVVAHIQAKGNVDGHAWMPDGRSALRLASEQVERFDVPSGEAHGSWKLKTRTRAACVNRAGRIAFVGGVDGGLHVLDLQAGASLGTLSVGSRVACDVALSPDEKHVLACAMSGEVAIWNTADWSEKPLSPGHHRPIRVVAASADGKFIASGGDDGRVIRWTATGKRERVLDAHRGPVTGLAFGPDGSLWSVGVDRMLMAFDRAGKKTQSVELPRDDAAASSMVLAGGGKRLVIGQMGGTVRWFDLGAKRLTKALRSHEAPVVRLAANADGTRVASADERGKVAVWNVESEAVVSEFATLEVALRGIAFVHGGDLITIGGLGTIGRWSTEDGRQKASGLLGGGDPFPVLGVTSIATTNYLAAASVDGLVFVDVDRLALVGKPTTTAAFPTSVHSLGDGSLLVSGLSDSTVSIWPVKVAAPEER